jgi:hypothetical protein
MAVLMHAQPVVHTASGEGFLLRGSFAVTGYRVCVTARVCVCRAWGANNVTVSHCVSHHNLNGFAPGSGTDGGGFDIDGGVSNSVFEYNYAFENQGEGYLVCQVCRCC